MMKLRKMGILVLSTVMPACLYAEGVSNDKAVTHDEVKRLERSIKTTKIKNMVIKKKNEELISRMKELESRISEMKKSLVVEEMKEEEKVE